MQASYNYKTSFLSICPKHFFAEFWNVIEDILLNKNTVKSVILQEKENKTKQKTKKGMKRKKPS